MGWKRGSSCVGAAILILLACGCSSPQATEAKYLAKGKKELERQKYAAAILYLKNAVQAQPRDAEPYYQPG